MQAIRVSGTWGREFGKTDNWLQPHSPFAKLARKAGIHCIPHHRIWSTVEDGLISEDIYDALLHKRRDRAWVLGGLHLKDYLEDHPEVDLVITHSHGAQVASFAAKALERDPPFWLLIDPPVRRESNIVEGYHRMRTGGIVQTISSTWNPYSWPRWAGARRWPWDRVRLPGAFVLDQPGGHSSVLRKAEKYEEWWTQVFKAVTRSIS